MKTSQELRDLGHIEALRKQAISLSERIQLKNTPETLWPFISNTDVINRKLGLAATKNSFKPVTEGGTVLQVEFKEMGMTMAYEELPFEWTAPEHLKVERIFKRGPLLYLCFESMLTRTPQNTTEITCNFKFASKFASFFFKKVMLQNLKKILEVYQEIDSKATPKPPMGPEAFLEPVSLHQSQIEALFSEWKELLGQESQTTSDIDSLLKEWGTQQLTQPSQESQIARKLAEFIFTAPERFLNKIRPFEIAKIYDLDQMQTLKFCLSATRAGFLDMSWDLLCPGCKGPKERTASLKDITGEAHCDSCNIDYDLKFDENVELTFSPAAKVRRVNSYAFCAGSPANTTHILSQTNLWPGQTQTLELQLSVGHYRFRSNTMKGSQEFVITEEEESDEFVINLDQEFSSLASLQLTSPLKLTLTNQAEYLQTLKVEKMAWKENVVTAAFVTSLQDFRDTFSSEVLQPGLQLAISNLVLMFTDLKDSTLIYDTHGDASAFNLVQTHFNLLLPIIRKYDGALVKTIGDAIMAVFQTELDTLKACFEVQRQFNEFNQERETNKQAIIKIGFHKGPCIALNLNNNLDYFGATVNKAARIQGQSVGNDICFTEEVYNQPEIQAFLEDHPHKVETFLATLKGIVGQAVIYKITPVF